MKPRVQFPPQFPCKCVSSGPLNKRCKGTGHDRNRNRSRFSPWRICELLICIRARVLWHPLLCQRRAAAIGACPTSFSRAGSSAIQPQSSVDGATGRSSKAPPSSCCRFATHDSDQPITHTTLCACVRPVLSLSLFPSLCVCVYMCVCGKVNRARERPDQLLICL